jgi:hypothetical protein
VIETADNEFSSVQDFSAVANLNRFGEIGSRHMSSFLQQTFIKLLQLLLQLPYTYRMAKSLIKI